MATDLVQYLTDCDSVKLSRVSLNYSVDPDVIPAGMVLESDVCTTKPKGILRLEIDSASVGFPDLDLKLAFGGKRLVGPGGEPLVLWTIDEPLNQYVSAFDVTLDRVKGQFTTALMDVTPAVRQESCEGLERHYGAFLATVGNGNGFLIEAHREIGGVDWDAEVKVENFAIDGYAGQPLVLDVAVKIPNDLCTHAVYEGGQAEAFAVTSGVPPGVIETYAWRVGGGVIVGSANQWRVNFTVPTQAPVTATVDVYAGGHSASASRTVLPRPESARPLIMVLCKLRTIAQINMFWDPLWDPLRDFSRRPITRAELARHVDLAKQLEIHARELGEAAETYDTRRSGSS